MTMAPQNDPLPLDGITVIDLSTLLPGPLASLMLAEAGARVIKVERPGGEDMRGFAPMLDGASVPFAILNAGKECIALDLKKPADKARLKALIAEADIVIEQFRPGVMTRLGLNPTELTARHPGLIYCAVTGYGQEGPRSEDAGHDLNYQALTGLLSLSPGTSEAPTIPPALTADIAGGAMPAVINILLALRRRDRTGRGCRIDIAMADAMFTFAWLALAQGHAHAADSPVDDAQGREARDHGFPGSRDTLLTGASPRYQLYPTADDAFLAVGALEQKFWDGFCDAIALPPALRDDRRDPQATREGVARIIRSRDAAHWRAHIEPRDCCCTIVRSLAEARHDPHFVARGLFAVNALLPASGSDTGAGRTVPLATLPIAPDLRRPLTDLRRVMRPGEADPGETG
jgi:alpha-methylacyl-CoA racemase